MLNIFRLFGNNKEKNRPILLIELLFDIVVVALLGGISHTIIKDIPTVASDPSYAFNLFQDLLFLITALVFWRVMMLYSLTYNDNPYLRLIKFMIMIPLLLQAVSAYLPETAPQEIDQRLYPYCYVAASLIVSIIYFIAGFNNAKGNRAHHFLIAIPFLITAISVPIVIEITSSIVLFDTDIYIIIAASTWAFTLALMIGGQIIAGQKRFNANHRPKLENLKERYSTLFIVFLGEYFLTIITSAANTTSKATSDFLAVFFLALVLALAWWWVYADVINYLDLRRTDNAMLVFSFTISASMIALLIMADGVALSLNANVGEYNYHQYGTYTFVAGFIALAITFGLIWFAMKQYGTRRRVIFTRRMQLINLVAYPFFIAGVIASAIVTQELVISLVLTLGCSVLFIVVLNIGWARRWKLPVSEEQFLREIAKFKYQDQWAEVSH